MTHILKIPRALGLSLALATAFPAWAATDLTELSLEQLMAIPVVGASKYEQKQIEVAAAVSVITREEIRTFGWRTLGQALASLPGLYTTYDRIYTYLGARGFSLPGDFNTRLLITINGMRVNEATYDSALVGHEFPLDVDLIERIEFIPGPGGAVYGQNAMFGVVNVITRTGVGVDGAELAASYLSPQAAGKGRASWGKVFDNGVDMLLSVSGLDADGEDRFYNYGDGVSGKAAGLDGERDQEVFAHVARGPWSFDLVYGDREKDDPTARYQTDPFVSGQTKRDEQLLTQLQYSDSFAGNRLHVLARVFLGEYRYDGVYSYGTEYRSTVSSSWRGAELRLLSTELAAHKLMVGLEVQDNTRKEQGERDLANPTNDYVIPGSGWRAGLYAQDEWAIADTLTATLGLRADRSSVTGTQLSPRVGLIWQATPATTLKGLYGRAHREPNSYERDYYYPDLQLPNPALGGETIDTLELVLDHRIASDLALRGSVFHWTMRDIIAWDQSSLQFQSGGEVKASGLELSGDKTWSWGGRLRGSISYQDVAYGNGAGLDNSPLWLGKLNFSSPLPAVGLRLGYELQYSSKRQAVDGTDLGGYGLSNLNLIADRWAKGLDVSLGIYNLFDKHYQHPRADGNWTNALEQDGRSVRLKLVYRF